MRENLRNRGSLEISFADQLYSIPHGLWNVPPTKRKYETVKPVPTLRTGCYIGPLGSTGLGKGQIGSQFEYSIPKFYENATISGCFALIQSIDRRRIISVSTIEDQDLS